MTSDNFLFLPDPVREGLILACILVIVSVTANRLYAFIKANRGK